MYIFLCLTAASCGRHQQDDLRHDSEMSSAGVDWSVAKTESVDNESWLVTCVLTNHSSQDVIFTNLGLLIPHKKRSRIRWRYGRHGMTAGMATTGRKRWSINKGFETTLQPGRSVHHTYEINDLSQYDTFEIPIFITDARTGKPIHVDHIFIESEF